ncbi:Hypothetical protein NTJ_04580 [Nesidiocoris tenuis]|uniref:Uncharacterized protein n=1 Tax=Nesidiocoris tenuis TaxID=355587 RepID=A0ABN7AKF5_9HEMI|nr:Hypothetical protein NTJ_04580 [Nesidiocoris tenuis]
MGQDIVEQGKEVIIIQIQIQRQQTRMWDDGEWPVIRHTTSGGDVATHLTHTGVGAAHLGQLTRSRTKGKNEGEWFAVE